MIASQANFVMDFTHRSLFVHRTIWTSYLHREKVRLAENENNSRHKHAVDIFNEPDVQLLVVLESVLEIPRPWMRSFLCSEKWVEVLCKWEARSSS